MCETKLWDQLNQYVDLYKFHWELSLKLCVFFLGISGAISAYVIKNQNIEYMSFALVLPIGLCLFGWYFAHRSISGLHRMRKEAYRLGEELKLQSYPEFRSLITFVGMLRIIFGLASLGMLVLWWLIKCHS